jgi:hypothetical protein
VTRASLREYAAVQRERYLYASRAEKHRLLNEVVAVAGLHRKAAIRLLRRTPGPVVRRPRAGRPRQYGPAVATAAQLLSEATGHIGPHRWHPFLPELLDRLTQTGDVMVTPEVDKHLRQVSPATLARLLAPFRRTLPYRGPHDDPPWGLAQARDPRPDLRRVDRRPAGLPRAGLGRPLWPDDPGLLPLHPLRRRRRHQLGRPPSRVGQGPAAGRHRHPSRPPTPADAAARRGQR